MDPSSGELADLSFDQLMELEARAQARAGEHELGADERAYDDAAVDDAAGETVVLPWWQHPVNIATMLVTVALLAAMIGWMVGDSGAQIDHNGVDTGFLQDMRAHHEQAVVMGLIYRNLPDTNPGLDSVAREIVRGQSIEVGRMVQLLRDFGELESNESESAMTWMGHATDLDAMPGMASQAELDRLGRASGVEADELFVELMTAHHTAGIEMAAFATEHGGNDEVRLMAGAMAAAQRSEIVEMAHLID